MREGLDADDIYIMVEDELYATAKTFTQHLHHAEYQRLKQLASLRNASTISIMSRPVAPGAVMSAETKKKRQRQAQATLQERRVRAVLSRTGPVDSNENSDIDVGVLEDDDPWAGTSLQGLMTSPSKKNRSLTGIHGVLSNTRAAAGYNKLLASKTTRDPSGNSPETKLMQRRTPKNTSETEDDDDLDIALGRGKGTTTARPRSNLSENQNNKTHFDSGKKEHRVHFRPPSPSPEGKRTAKAPRKTNEVEEQRSRFHLMDAFPTPTPLLGSRKAKSRHGPEVKKVSKNMKGDIHEIPVFLI